jgi:hypothetical protein
MPVSGHDGERRRQAAAFPFALGVGRAARWADGVFAAPSGAAGEAVPVRAPWVLSGVGLTCRGARAARQPLGGGWAGRHPLCCCFRARGAAGEEWAGLRPGRVVVCLVFAVPGRLAWMLR